MSAILEERGPGPQPTPADPGQGLSAAPAPSAAWLAALELRECQLVELLALWSGEVPLMTVHALLELTPVPFRGKVLHRTRLLKSLEAVPAGTLNETHSGLIWSDPQRRRQALQSFRTSGRAAIWAECLGNLLNLLRTRGPGEFSSHGRQTYQGVLRAALLGGAPGARVAAAFRAHHASWSPQEPTASGVPEPAWRGVLHSLERLAGSADGSGAAGAPNPMRLKVVLSKYSPTAEHYGIEFSVQAPSKRGGWTSGRSLYMPLSAEVHDVLERLPAHDRPVVQAWLRSLARAAFR